MRRPEKHQQGISWCSVGWPGSWERSNDNSSSDNHGFQGENKSMAFNARTKVMAFKMRPYKILDQCCLWCRGLQTVRDRQISGGDLFSSKFKANSPNWNTSGVKEKQKQRNQFKFSFEHFQDWSLEIDKVSGPMFPPTLPDLLMNFWAWKVSPDKLIFDP